MTEISTNPLDTPRTSKWRKQLSFESDEECNKLQTEEIVRRDDGSKLRMRLFEEDEESRDSGLGMGDHLDDDLSFELPVRRFAIFAEEHSAGETNDLCNDKINELSTTMKSENIHRCTLKSSQKRVRSVTIQETSPLQQKRQRRNSFTAVREHCQRNSQPCHGLDALFTASISQLPLVAPMSDPTLNDSGSEGESLSGDNSRKLILSTIAGKHPDLNSVTPDTLARVIKLDYVDSVSETVIIDCRYPYEYEGGHIKGAINCFTKDSLMERFFSTHQLPDTSSKRSILIFHCEFSSERAPKMSRFLREMDRKANQWSYPKLNYPEVYLLHGGYKNFFEHHKELCTPHSYVPMHHKDHREDMRKFRIKSKSWSGDKKTRSVFGLKNTSMFC